MVTPVFGVLLEPPILGGSSIHSLVSQADNSCKSSTARLHYQCVCLLYVCWRISTFGHLQSSLSCVSNVYFHTTSNNCFAFISVEITNTWDSVMYVYDPVYMNAISPSIILRISSLLKNNQISKISARYFQNSLNASPARAAKPPLCNTTAAFAHSLHNYISGLYNKCVRVLCVWMLVFREKLQTYVTHYIQISATQFWDEFRNIS